MFEQQQNTGKSTSLAEKYANAVGQLSVTIYFSILPAKK